MYDQNGKCTPSYGNEKPKPSQLNRMAYGNMENIIRRFSDIIGLDATTSGIVPASTVKTDEGSKFSYYNNYCTLVGSTYIDFYVKVETTGSVISVYPGLAWDTLGRRVSITDSNTYDGTKPSAVDTWGYRKPKSTGCRNIDISTLGAGTWNVYVRYISVVNSDEYSVDPNNGAVRYTDIEDGYEIVLSQTTPAGYPIFLASFTKGTGTPAQSDISYTGRVYLRLPASLIAAYVDSTLISAFTHIASRGTGTYSASNPHAQSVTNLDDWEDVENTVAAYFASAMSQGIVSSAQSVLTPSINTLAQAVLNIQALDSTSYIFINGFRYISSQITAATSTPPTIAVAANPYSITFTSAMSTGYYWVYFSGIRNSSTYSCELNVSATEPASTSDMIVCKVYWNGTLLSALTDLRQFGLTGSTALRADAATNTVTINHNINATAYFRNGYSLKDIGEIKYFAKGAPNATWLACDGSSFDASTYPDLYTYLGSNILPNCSGRTLIGAGTVTDANGNTHVFVAGDSGGELTHKLTLDEMPAHTHITPVAIGSNTGSSSYHTDDTYDGTKQTGSTGGDGYHNNLQPYYVAGVYIRAL